MYNHSDDEILQRINLGVRRGVARALADHKKNGQSIVVMQGGKIVRIPPEEIEFDESLLSDSPDKTK